jgi:hypothetical protein
MFKEDLINDIADGVMRLQEKENDTIPFMQKQLTEIHQSINNLVKAMEMGNALRETKQRFDELEARMAEFETDMIKQGIQEEIITREQLVEWLEKMKRLELSSDDSKRKLVDYFVNSVYLYNDKVVINFNCRKGASTLAENSVFDEPTIGVDGVGKETIRNFIRELNEQNNITMLFTTHDMQDIEKTCKRLIIIDEGAKVYDGSLMGIRERYGTSCQLDVEFSGKTDVDPIEKVEIEELENNKNASFSRAKMYISTS